MRPREFIARLSPFAITDEQAMWRVQTEADEHAFAQLVRRWGGAIQRLGERVTGGGARGEDLAQEAFARVFASRATYQPGGKFSTWLWRIALNLCYDELRRRQRRGESSLDDVGDGMLEVLAAVAAPEPAPDRSLAERER